MADWARHTWYPVDGLTRDSFPVFVLALDRQLVAFRKRAGRRISWRVRDVGNRTIDLPDIHWPTLFRPIDPAKFPDPLPEPARLVVPPAPPPPRVAETPDPDDEFYWPERYHEPPHIERREAEVRFVRACRTLDALMRPPPASSGSVWPGALLIKARLVEMRMRASKSGLVPGLRAEDYDDFHVDRSELRALPARFVPTRLDLADFETGVQWTNALSRVARRVLLRRADLPPYSFRQIGEELGVSRQRAKQIYEHALDDLADAANRPARTTAKGDRF